MNFDTYIIICAWFNGKPVTFRFDDYISAMKYIIDNINSAEFILNSFSIEFSNKNNLLEDINS